MKEVISKEKLEKIMVDAVNMICDAVSNTLGPKGSNVLINSSLQAPFITNDGVTIASSIESNDLKINSILEIIKEASLKTNELVGDGTTTTLVLLQSIFIEGLKEIKNGYNAIKLKRELNETLDKVLEEINKLKITPTKNNLEEVAMTSVNDKKLGKLITEIFLEMGNKYAIKIEESKNGNTYYNINKGYKLDIDNINNIYFQNQSEIVLNNCYILIIRGYLNDLETIAPIINEGLERDKNILILCVDTTELIEQEILLYYVQENKNIFLFKTPDYGSRKIDIINDIKLLSDANVKNIDYENIGFDDLGTISKVIIDKESITLLSDKNIDKEINNLKEEYLKCQNDYDKSFLSKRLAYLDKGIATIYVGGNTRVEIKEKMMRVEDSLCALNIANNGVLIGEGITLMNVSDKLDDKILSEKILKKSFKVPFRKIMENCGEEYLEIEKEIKESNYQKIFNTYERKIESIKETNILDPVEVVTTSIKNAISIASILLTTNYLVINESFNNKEIEI